MAIKLPTVPETKDPAQVRSCLATLIDAAWYLYKNQTSPGGADTQIQFNNAGAFGGSASLTWDDATKTMQVRTPGGSFNVGDLDGTSNGCRVDLDEAGQVFNVTIAGSERFRASSTQARFNMPNGTVELGDPDFNVNGTILSVDDANTRGTFNQKFVIANGGSLYLYDSGTSTYWKWESINGVWTGTDTTSGSLP